MEYFSAQVELARIELDRAREPAQLASTRVQQVKKAIAALKAALVAAD